MPNLINGLPIDMISLFRRMARVKLKYFVPGLVAFCFLLDYFGAFTHFFELDYHASFEYPLEGDVRKWAEQVSLPDRQNI